MIDHVNLPVSDLARATRFYTQVLAELGVPPLIVDVNAQGFGHEDWGFGIVATQGPITALHVAFVAPDRPSVDRFHRMAISLGARDNGAPGLRETYDPNYYAAFVIDADGHNVEAVCRKELT
jgi:catechol 2,3-dioxygenase-like lactoylglutathione lyase family enzyme